MSIDAPASNAAGVAVSDSVFLSFDLNGDGLRDVWETGYFGTLAQNADDDFDNGLGGFASDGREYVIAPPAGQRPPAPWVNVIANPRFGTVVSEAGSAYTWCEIAHELRLTPWHNDPVCDTGGETWSDMPLEDESKPIN